MLVIKRVRLAVRAPNWHWCTANEMVLQQGWAPNFRPLPHGAGTFAFNPFQVFWMLKKKISTSFRNDMTSLNIFVNKRNELNYGNPEAKFSSSVPLGLGDDDVENVPCWTCCMEVIRSKPMGPLGGSEKSSPRTLCLSGRGVVTCQCQIHVTQRGPFRLLQLSSRMPQHQNACVSRQKHKPLSKWLWNSLEVRSRWEGPHFRPITSLGLCYHQLPYETHSNLWFGTDAAYHKNPQDHHHSKQSKVRDRQGSSMPSSNFSASGQLACLWICPWTAFPFLWGRLENACHWNHPCYWNGTACWLCCDHSLPVLLCRCRHFGLGFRPGDADVSRVEGLTDPWKAGHATGRWGHPRSLGRFRMSFTGLLVN